MESILQNKEPLGDILFENVDACAVRMLREETEYQKLKEWREELSRQNPFINELYDSDGSMSLTEEQHRILREEMELTVAVSQYERREYFWIGQQYILEWMNHRKICCGQDGGTEPEDISGRKMEGG
ncbi:MAG: hypothetical protein NC293_06510 [Roseburia sp.]|nr:hypothetical protein [Roseburia sp.]